MATSTVATVLASALAAVIGYTQLPAPRLLSTGGFANAISGGTAAGSLANRAVLWSNSATIDMHPAGFTSSAITGRSGTLSVGYAGGASPTQVPLLWQGSAASTLPVPFSYVYGRAIATDGRQVVGYAAETDAETTVGDSHALLWDLATGTVTDLGRGNALNGVGGGVQVGTTMTSQGTNAALWRGTPNSMVDLHVTGNDISVACDTNGTIQVGYVGIDIRVRNEARPRDIRFYSAGYWTGTAASFTYLPSAYRHSFALATKGDTIVGYGNTSDPIGTPRDSHAVAWVGPAHTFVDLHATLPADMRTSRATGVDALGNIVGYGVTTAGVVRSYIWARGTSQPMQMPIEP